MMKTMDTLFTNFRGEMGKKSGTSDTSNLSDSQYTFDYYSEGKKNTMVPLKDHLKESGE